MHADRRTLVTREELTLQQQKLRESSRLEEDTVTAIDFLPVLRSWWEGTHPGGTGP
jgi:hypothetical protein